MGEAGVFFLIDQLVLPTDLEEEFEEVDLSNDGSQILDLSFRLCVLGPEEELKRIEEEMIDLPTERVTMNFRNMSDETLPRLVRGFQSDEEINLSGTVGGG